MKYLKWAVILIMIFLSCILAMPFFVVTYWLTPTRTNTFLENIGRLLQNKILGDFEI